MNKFNHPFAVIPGFYFSRVLIKEADPLLPLPKETLSEPVEPFLRLLLLFELTPSSVDEEKLPWDNITGGSSTITMILSISLRSFITTRALSPFSI